MFIQIFLIFPATVAVVYYKSIMSRKPLDINQELALGTKSPESVFADMNDLIDATLTPNADLSTVKVTFDGLRTGSKVIKDVFGQLKEPVAARLSVIDMVTSEYIVTSTRFILNSVNTASTEKFQVMHSFDEEWLFSVLGKGIAMKNRPFLTYFITYKEILCLTG